MVKVGLKGYLLLRMPDLVPILLKDQKLPGAALLALATMEFGLECLEWEPAIIRDELSTYFNVPLTHAQSDKLQAAIIVLSTDHFESDWHTFNVVTHCLNSEPVYYDTFDPVDAEQIAATMPEVQIIRNQFIDGDLKFSDEVNTYAGLIFSEYGLLFTPHIFPTAQMPNLQGEFYVDSQTEKQDALSEVYAAKKQQIEHYLTRVQNCYTI